MQRHHGEPVLEARGLDHVYRSGQGDIAALKNASLEVRAGEFVAIIGPSGCGKSTLLRILGGLLRPTAGSVRLDGQPLSAPQRQVAYVFQNVNLMPWRTVLSNVLLPLEVAGTPRVEAMRRAESVLSLVELRSFVDLYPRELSGGMAQRVAIARALVAEPELLLLDEPFGALDALSREQMNLELLRIWRARRVTAVMVTHDLQEAIFLADRVLVMSARPGEIKAEIHVDLPRPRTLEVMYTEFFGALSRRVREVIREAQGQIMPTSTADHMNGGTQ